MNRKSFTFAFDKFGFISEIYIKTKALIYQGFLRRRTPLFDKNVRKAGFIHFGGPEEDRTPEPFGCEPNALPAELRAHIDRFSIKKSDEKRIFEIFNFEGKVRNIERKIGRKNRAGDGSPYGCEPYALPAELWAHIGHFPSKKVMKTDFQDIRF